MSYQNQSFGMMDEGYFVPRGEIIAWINSLLKTNMTKIEQLGAGSIYCQILDVIYPGKIPLSKVNWKAKLEYQFISNLKILQNSFDKLGIKKHLQIQKISKAKYQDNLQLIQWFKRYYDLNCGQRGNNYQAEQRRSGIVPDFSFADKTIIPKVHNSSQINSLNVIKQKSTITSKKSYQNIEKSPMIQKIQGKTSKKSNLSPNFENNANIIHDMPPISKKTKQQQKLEMISDIIRNSEQSDEDKIKLIEEVLNIDF